MSGDDEAACGGPPFPRLGDALSQGLRRKIALAPCNRGTDPIINLVGDPTHALGADRNASREFSLSFETIDVPATEGNAVVVQFRK
jgi:hypothetical protein